MSVVSTNPEIGPGVEWCPLLPIDWGRARLRWLARIFAGGTPDRDNPAFWEDGTIPWLNSGAVNDWIISTPSEYISESAYMSSSARWIPANSVVIGLAGQGRTKGTSARLEIESTCNQSMAAIVPNSEIDYRFLHYWLVANYQSIRNMSGGDKRDGLNLQHIGSIECPVPPMSTQRAIADYLDHEIVRIALLVEEQQRLIELLRERRASTIDRIVWNGVADAETAPTGIDLVPSAPRHWRRLRNKNLLTESTILSEDGSEELLTVSHLTGITPRSEKSVNMIEAESLVGYRVVQPADLVINTMWAWMGALGVSPTSGIVSPAYGVYRPIAGADFHPQYFDYLYRSRPYVAEMTRHSRGVWESRLRLYPDAFLSLPTVVPPLEEQRAITAYLDDKTARIDDLIAETDRFIELSRERRSALIEAAVTGRISVHQKVSLWGKSTRLHLKPRSVSTWR